MTDREQTPQHPTAPTAGSGPAPAPGSSGEGATAVPPPGRDATARDATTRDGTTRDGTTQDGTTRDGTVRDGTSRDETTRVVQPVGGDTTRVHPASEQPVREETARHDAPRFDARQVDDRREDTPPQGTPAYAGGPVAAPAGTAVGTAPEYTTRPVAVRRADTLAGILLVLAGAAASISLLLRWVAGNDVTGAGLLRDGLRAFGDGRGFSSGLWQPTAVVLGGGVLLVLGLLVLVPARTHRFLGLVALLVAIVTAVAVLVPLAQASWDLSTFDTGIWFAIAVPVLGLLGALKALATGPKQGGRTHHGA